MGKGTNLAREIIDMTKEYNRQIKMLYNQIDELRDDNKDLKERLITSRGIAEEKIKHQNMLVHDLEEKLTAITDIICHHIKHINGSNYIDSIWDWENDYHKLIELLDITVGVSKTEGEKENEN